MAELTPLSILITADADDLKAELSAARAALAKFENQAGKTGKGTKQLNGIVHKLGITASGTQQGLRLLPYQLNQIAQSGAVTGHWLTSVNQQIPDILAGFGGMPLVLAGGALAMTGALIPALMGTKEEARDLEAAMSDFVAAGDEVKRLGDLLAMSADQMALKYGVASEEIRKTALALLELKQVEIERAFAEQVELLQEATREYTGYAATALRSGKSLTAAWQTVQKELGVSTEQAVALRDAFIEVGNAGTMEQQQVAMANLRDLLEQSGVEATKLPPELFKALEHMYNLQITSADVAGYLSDANVNAGLLGQTLGNIGSITLDSFRLPTDVELGKQPGRKPSGGARSNPLEAQLEALQNSLMSQEEAEIASYERRKKTLDDALEAGLLKSKEHYAHMEDLNEQHGAKMASIDAYRYGDGLQATSAFLGDMANALAQGNEKMMQISKVFGAAEALISAYKGAAKELEKGVFGFATAATVLAKGFAFVQAIQGVGKGGGGRTSTGGSSAGSVAAASPPAAQSMNRSLTLIGDNFNRKQAIQIAEFLNEGSDDGLIVRGR